jgi:hypothetical protein
MISEIQHVSDHKFPYVSSQDRRISLEQKKKVNQDFMCLSIL